MDEEMSAKEAARLADWLKAHGMTDADFSDCIHYIAGTKPDADAEPAKG